MLITVFSLERQIIHLRRITHEQTRPCLVFLVRRFDLLKLIHQFYIPHPTAHI